MRAVVQRVSKSSVEVDGSIIGSIEQGLLVLLGVGEGDTSQDAKYLAQKIVHLRIFEDAAQKMNQSVLDIEGKILAVSQFTLYGDVRKGRRPGFEKAASPELAKTLYEEFISACQQEGVPVETGQFQADMKVSLVNEGPVTILLDSSKLF